MTPQQWLKTIAGIKPWLFGGALFLLGVGLPWALLWSPADYQQGEVVRILYVHVPTSWMALLLYVVMAIASGAAFINRLFVGHLLTRALAPVGFAMTLASLVTGSLWGLPTWGTWWVWDARLTSMLLLLFLYMGYGALLKSYDYSEKGLQAGGVLVLVGVVNIPIIKWSVTWWNTLHQPASVLRLDKPALHPELLAPLLVMACGMAAYAFGLGLWRLEKLLILRQRLQQALRSAAPLDVAV